MDTSQHSRPFSSSIYSPSPTSARPNSLQQPGHEINGSVGHSHDYLKADNLTSGGDSLHDSSEMSSITTMMSTQTNAESIDRKENTKPRKNFKTEYKSKFTPFDQYVYNEITDSFVKQTVDSTSDSHTSIRASSSNQDLASHDSSRHTKHQQISTSHSGNTLDVHLFEPNSTSRTDLSNIGAEPWYKECVRRHEKANEYRFKSEVGHNSPLLNYNVCSTPSSTTDCDGKTARNSPYDLELTSDMNQKVETHSQNGDRITSSEENSQTTRGTYRFSPSDYRRDHMIADMAKNNNFNLPKDVPDARSNVTSHKTQARSAAQVRAKSQTSQRRPIGVSSTTHSVVNTQSKPVDISPARSLRQTNTSSLTKKASGSPAVSSRTPVVSSRTPVVSSKTPVTTPTSANKTQRRPINSASVNQRAQVKTSAPITEKPKTQGLLANKTTSQARNTLGSTPRPATTTTRSSNLSNSATRPTTAGVSFRNSQATKTEPKSSSIKSSTLRNKSSPLVSKTIDKSASTADGSIKKSSATSANSIRSSTKPKNDDEASKDSTGIKSGRVFEQNIRSSLSDQLPLKKEPYDGIPKAGDVPPPSRVDSEFDEPHDLDIVTEKFKTEQQVNTVSSFDDCVVEDNHNLMYSIARSGNVLAEELAEAQKAEVNKGLIIEESELLPVVEHDTPDQELQVEQSTVQYDVSLKDERYETHNQSPQELSEPYSAVVNEEEERAKHAKDGKADSKDSLEQRYQNFDDEPYSLMPETTSEIKEDALQLETSRDITRVHDIEENIAETNHVISLAQELVGNEISDRETHIHNATILDQASNLDEIDNSDVSHTGHPDPSDHVSHSDETDILMMPELGTVDQPDDLLQKTDALVNRIDGIGRNEVDSNLHESRSVFEQHKTEAISSHQSDYLEPSVDEAMISDGSAALVSIAAPEKEVTLTGFDLLSETEPHVQDSTSNGLVQDIDHSVSPIDGIGHNEPGSDPLESGPVVEQHDSSALGPRQVDALEPSVGVDEAIISDGSAALVSISAPEKEVNSDELDLLSGLHVDDDTSNGLVQDMEPLVSPIDDIGQNESDSDPLEPRPIVEQHDSDALVSRQVDALEPYVELDEIRISDGSAAVVSIAAPEKEVNSNELDLLSGLHVDDDTSNELVQSGEIDIKDKTDNLTESAGTMNGAKDSKLPEIE